MYQWEQADRWFDAYDILKVDRSAKENQIKKAYHKLARTTHPDAGGSEEAFKRVSEAYEALTKSGEKSAYNKAYDEWVAHGRPEVKGSIRDRQFSPRSHGAPQGGGTQHSKGASAGNGANSSATGNDPGSGFDEQYYAEGAVYREDIRAYVDTYAPVVDSAIKEVNQKRKNPHYADTEADFAELQTVAKAFVNDLEEYYEKAKYYGLTAEMVELETLAKKTVRRIVKLEAQIKLQNTTQRIDEFAKKLDSMFENFNTFLENVYLGKETADSYKQTHGEIAKTVGQCFAEIDAFIPLLKQAGLNAEQTNLTNTRHDLHAQFENIPPTLELALKDVFVGRGNTVYGLSNNGGAFFDTKATTYFGVHFAKNTIFNEEHNFVKCLFDSECDFAPGCNFTDCTIGPNAIVNAYGIPARDGGFWGVDDPINGRIVNCRFSHDVHLEGCMIEGQGTTVRNSTFGDKCKLGDNMVFNGCTFGYGCEAGWNANGSIVIDGVRTRTVPSGTYARQGTSAQMGKGSNGGYGYGQQGNSSQSQYNYHPQSDPYNAFRSFDLQGDWLIWHGVIETVTVQPGQKFVVRNHTIQILEEGILIDGKEPTIGGVPIDVAFMTYDQNGETMKFVNGSIDVGDFKRFNFDGDNVMYGDSITRSMQMVDPSAKWFNPFAKKQYQSTQTSAHSAPNPSFRRRFI